MVELDLPLLSEAFEELVSWHLNETTNWHVYMTENNHLVASREEIVCTDKSEEITLLGQPVCKLVEPIPLSPTLEFDQYLIDHAAIPWEHPFRKIAGVKFP